MTTIHDLPAHLAARIFAEGGHVPRDWPSLKEARAWLEGSPHLRGEVHLSRAGGDMYDALLCAVVERDADAARDLLSRLPPGAERLELVGFVRHPTRELPPISVAAQQNDAATFAAILEAMPHDDAARAMPFSSVVHVAASYGSVDVIRAVASATSRECLAESVARCDSAGFTPLHIAAARGHAEAVQEMLACLADDDAARCKALECIYSPYDDSAGITALGFAAMAGHEDVVSMLLAVSGANAARDPYGVTPLHYAALGMHANVVSTVLEALPSEPRARAAAVAAVSDDGRTPMGIAVTNGDLPTVRAMLSALRRAGQVAHAVTLPCEGGAPPIHLAAMYGHADIVCALLSALPDEAGRARALLQRAGPRGMTPACIAAGRGHRELHRLLRAMHPRPPPGMAFCLLLALALCVGLVALH